MEHLARLLVQANEEITTDDGLRYILWDRSNFSTNNILWTYVVYFFTRWFIAWPSLPLGNLQYLLAICWGIPLGENWIDVPYQPDYKDRWQ